MAPADDKLITVTPLAGVGKPLGYRVPGPMGDQVDVGSLVRIPLRNRSELGLVQAEGVTGDFPVERLKFIHGAVHPFPVVTPDLLKLGQWMGRYYGAPLEHVFEVMLPRAVRQGMKLREARLLSLARRLEADEEAALRKRAPKQAMLYRVFADQLAPTPLPRQKLLTRLQLAPSSADALVQKGILAETLERVDRDAYADDLAEAEVVASQELTLNPDQQAAVDDLLASLAASEYRTHLLHGVTGSGKTEVYLRVLAEAVKDGGGALFLVPEVALTPQTVGRLRARLEATSGLRAVVWHSHLSDGERLDAWHDLATGRAQIVVGARSAVFAPVRNLRLIIVDEEHEPAYKQEESPRYHGRDVAVYRAMLNGSLCVLGSATPSLETLHNTGLGRYRRNKLPKRVDDRELPLIHVVDMTREMMSRRGAVTISRMLADKMRERFEAKEQTILFLNRRGYDTSMLCPDCGWVASCPHCTATLTHHLSDGQLRCHLCGYEEPSPQACPACRSAQVRGRGFGTQKVETMVQKIVPGAKVVRIDTDTMQKKNLFRVILGDFRKGQIDILVGTQMIAKGLDFPNVTLVGLVGADLSLNLPDFRASERTFQLLVQVSGRAGRGERAGEVVVQSFLPANPAIQFGRRHDFDGFIEEELAARAEFRYPPYRHLINHLFRGDNAEKVAFYAGRWVEHLEAGLYEGIEIRGPAPAPIEKIRNQYRFRVWYFVANVSKFMPKLMALRETFPLDASITDVIDVDPMSLG